MLGPRYEIMSITLDEDDDDAPAEQLMALGADGWQIINGQLFHCGECDAMHERVWVQRRLEDQPRPEVQGIT